MARALLLARQGRLDEALVQAENVLALTQVTGDNLLRRHALLTKADLLQQLGRTDQLSAAVDAALGEGETQSPEMFAHYEAIMAAACSSEHRKAGATMHHERALRICKAIANVPVEIDVVRSWDRATAAQSVSSAGCASVPTAGSGSPNCAGRAGASRSNSGRQS